MAELSKNFISFVALGGQNPQILNLDFLKAENILPVNEEPFVSLLAQEKPMKKFVSVPGLTNLVVGNVEFIVDEQRFQVRETGISQWTDAKVLDIAKRYFEVLPYTPLKLVGVNLNSTITFATSEEAKTCQQLCLPQDSKLARIISGDNVSASTVLRYRYSGGRGRITLTIEQPNRENSKRMINFNYEFEFADWANFRTELEKIPDVAAYSESVLAQLLEAI